MKQASDTYWKCIINKRNGYFVMINLTLAILCSTIIAVLMRVLDSKIKNNMAMFTANYIMCCGCSLFFLFKDSGKTALRIETGTSGLSFAVLLGAIVGVFYLLSFLLLQFNIQKNGVILASTFMKLGVLVPVLMAIIFFHDKPSLMQILGFVIALIAIVVINGNGKDKSQAFLWLIVLLLVGGLTDSASNIYDKMGKAEFSNHYLLSIFVAAMFASIIGIFAKKQRLTVKDFLCGLCIGLPNYFSSRFLLKALATVPAIVAYPVYNVAVILLISFIGVLIFKEKMGIRKLIGLLLIICAIVLEVI